MFVVDNPVHTFTCLLSSYSIRLAMVKSFIKGARRCQTCNGVSMIKFNVTVRLSIIFVFKRKSLLTGNTTSTRCYTGMSFIM